MNKLHAILLTTLFYTTHILNMVNQPIIPVPENFTDDLTNQIFHWAVKHPNQKTVENNIELIHTISSLNKTWNGYVNDPIVTHITINNIAKKWPLARGWIAHKLATPGAKNYLIYSRILYNLELSPNNVLHFTKNKGTKDYLCSLENLSLDIPLINICINKGGDINYYESTNNSTLIQRLISLYYKKTITIKAVELALQYGAKTEATADNKYNIAYNAIKNDTLEIIELLYKYNRKLENKVEGLLDNNTLKKTFLRRKHPDCDLAANDKIIDLLLNNDYTLEEALQIATVTLNRDLVERFIIKGANPRKIDISFFTESAECALNRSEQVEYSYDQQQAFDILELLTLHGIDTSSQQEVIKLLL